MSWWIWLAIALVLGIIEMLSTTFVLMWIGIAGAATAVLTIFDPNLWVQVAVFAVISAVLLIVTRPMVRRWKSSQSVPDLPGRMIGKKGIVVTAPADEQLGTVRVQGEMWSAASGQKLSPGDQIVIVRANSSVLEVERTDP